MLVVSRLGHGVARGISSMQIGKLIDLSMERKCLSREGGPTYIDFLWGYVVMVAYPATRWCVCES